jgi:hypothetical protein
MVRNIRLQHGFRTSEWNENLLLMKKKRRKLIERERKGTWNYRKEEKTKKGKKIMEKHDLRKVKIEIENRKKTTWKIVPKKNKKTKKKKNEIKTHVASRMNCLCFCVKHMPKLRRGSELKETSV